MNGICYNGISWKEVPIMFCPVCWTEYPKGMRECDHCRAELVEEKPKEHAGQEPTAKTSAPPDKKADPKK
jgi:hypothetical protein